MAVALFSKEVEVHSSAVMVVLDTYPRMIIEIVGNQWPPKLVLKLTKNEKDQSFMRKITPLQRHMISKLDVTGYNNLDVSCLYKLIRHFNLLPVPKQGWGNKPSINDINEEDDVERMKIYRNDILHRPRGGLSEKEGKHFFQVSYDMAKRLDISIGSPMNGFEVKIKTIQCFSVDRQKYMEALEKCAEYQAQLQETRDTPSVILYYGNDIMMKLGSTDNQDATDGKQCSIYIRDESLDVYAVIQKLDYIKKTLEKGPYNVIKLDGAEIGSLILHISIPNRCFVTKETLHDSLQSFLHHFFLIAGIQCKTERPIVLAESDRYTTDDDIQDLQFLLEDPLPILKLNVKVPNSALQDQTVLYNEVNKFVTGMYDAMDSNGVPVNGSQKEVMMLTVPDNDIKGHLMEPYTTASHDNPIDVNTDYHWRRFVMELCHGQIVTNVIPSGLLPNLGLIFCGGHKKYIRSLERMASPQQAMAQLLEILDQQDNEGKWQIFKEALIENDYQWLVDFIEGDFVTYADTHDWENLINVFQKTVSANIKPQEILPYLKEKSVISDKDLEEVEQMCNFYGENLAVFQLLTFLPKCKHNIWYPEFIKILYENGYGYVVKDIDLEKYAKLQVHGSALFDSIYVDKTGERTEADQMTMAYVKKENSMPDIEKPEKPEISYLNMNSDDRLAHDYWLYFQSSTIRDSNIDNNNPLKDEFNKGTREKQLARTLQTQLPAPARSGKNSKNLPSVPDTIIHEPQPTDDGYTVFEDMEAEGYDYDHDELGQQKEPLTLRNYQQELARPALEGKNCLIVAPAGSGKTHVALKIMQEHMTRVRERRHPKVIFLVEYAALAQQQAKMCAKYLSCKVKLITGETQRKERKNQNKFSEWLAKHDILVVTSQLVVNALIEQDVKIDDFTLMVFDECQHFQANHCDNKIMKAYMVQKINHQAEQTKLPMIVGMTASLVVERAETTENAIDWIKTLMANMDAEELSVVRVHTKELSEHVIATEQVIKRTARRTKNYFGEALGKVMEVTERYMNQSVYVDCFDADKDKILKAPSVKGSHQYTQWIRKLWTETVFNQEARRFFTTCRTFLSLYNRALIIYEDARVKDALDFLEDNVRLVHENLRPNETDYKMFSLYTKTKILLYHCAVDVNHQNPKLETLKKLIAITYKQNMDSRGVIFVKTRDVVKAIKNWMKETDGLKVLNPSTFVGAQDIGEKGGLKNTDINDLIQYFKEGRHKLIIATSAVQERLDIQKCNLVIRYDHVTDEIAMMQARGRGRHEGSQYYLIASEQSMTAEKQEVNIMMEARMNQAIVHLQNCIRDNKETFKKEIEDLQMETIIQRELENANKGGRIIGDLEFEMRCVSENPRRSTNSLSCPKEKDEDSIEELQHVQDSIISNLMSFDENNLQSLDQTSEKNVVTTESTRPQVVNKDMSLSSDPGEREPTTLLYERINRDLAITVSDTAEEIQHNILQMPYDDVVSDSDSEDETIPQKVLNLREYQKELAEPAKEGKNCLIVAPTGCGKPHVITDIIQDHNSKMSRKGLIVKVAVLVEQQALAEQLAERCKEYLQPLRVKLITGEIHREEILPKPLSSWLKRRDILVITSALLNNSLKSGDIKIEDFTLLVFDECHHAEDKHSYARVMHYYMDRKFDDNFSRERLPKVIGLTASVVVGKSTKIPGAKNHIKATMSNLDAEELVTVKTNILELSEHVVVPDKGIIVAPARQKDHFGKTLVKLMESTEKHIFTTPHAKMFDGKDSILKAPTEKGSDTYTQWISRLRRETAQIKEEARRYITTWRSYLNVYNQALIIYEDARVKDATNYLEDKMDYLNEGIIKNEIDDTMKRLYDITKPMFVACIDDKSYENPKLKELKTVIFKMLREKRDSRIIVFIKTRDLADAMVNWMRETDGLDRLKPHKFVGAQAAGAKGGMTKKDQTEILKLFKDGNRQIVCATSVAEEGLDIPTCNLVIRYDHVTNETAMIQSRGRGRAEGCQFIIIASEKRKTAEKEEINEIREEIMKEAIEEIQSDIKDNKEEFVEELEEIQRLAKTKRDKDALSEKGSSDNKELELRCEKCNHYICMSTDIKKIQDAHHAVVNDEIRKNVTVIKCYSKRIDHQISVNAGKVKCINCGSGLGQIIKFSEAQFPVLKIEHFYVTDTTGKNSYYKKWKDVPFKPTALSDDDLESRLQGPQYVDI